MTTPLEQSMPVYHFRERHSRWIDASPEQVWQALTTLTLDQLTLTRPLVAIRHFAAHTAAPTKPLFTDGPVRIFEITPPIYAVGGAVRWKNSPDLPNLAGPSTSPTFTSNPATVACSSPPKLGATPPTVEHGAASPCSGR